MAQPETSPAPAPAAPRGVFAERRAAYMKALGPRAVALCHSPPEALRNGDAHYRFRQSSDLHYLTGFSEPESTLVLRPGAPEGQRVTLFVRPRDPEREVWDGRRAGVDGACREFGADQAFPVAELERRLPELLGNADELHYSLGTDAEFDGLILRMLAGLRQTERRGLRPPRRVVDPREILHEMRLIKSGDEVDILRRAAAITAEAHTAAMRAAAAGVAEYELEALIDYTFRRAGGSGPGYTTIVGSGANATVLHYIENDARLGPNDLVLVDAGCELELYTADVTRTFPVSGRFSPAQRRVYEVVLDAQERAIAMVRPGVTLEDLHKACVERLCEGMIALGLLEGPAAERIEDGSYRRFYMHRTSHWLGLDVHDVGAYTDEQGRPRPLAPGMVITIEPGLYVAALGQEDGERGAAGDAVAARQLAGIGVRIEDDILVTEDGCEVLTRAVPKTVDEVERACQS